MRRFMLSAISLERFPASKASLRLFIGGTSSPLGPLVGGLLLGVMEVAAARYLPSIYAEGIAFALLMIILFLRPSGLIAARRRRNNDARDPGTSSRRLYLLGLAIAGIVALLPLAANRLSAHAGGQSLHHPHFDPEPEFRRRQFGPVSPLARRILRHRRLRLGDLRKAIQSVAVAVPACAIVAVATLAALIGLPVTRLKGLYLAVATLAFSLFVEVLVNQGGAVTGGGYGIQDIPPGRAVRVPGCRQNRFI